MQSQSSQQQRIDDIAPVTPSDRVLGLDGLRGLALIMVLFAHYSRFGALPTTAVPDRVFRQVTDSGWIALDIFFVLSGFLITGILLDSKRGGKYFRNFYARRGLRILPPYYAYVLFLLFVLPLVLPDHDYIHYAVARDKFWFLTYAMNIRIGLDHGLRPDLPFSVHLWSMGVEEQFYFVWPFVVLLLKPRQLMAACGLAVAISIATRTSMYMVGLDPWISYAFTPARMDCLAIGSFLAIAMRDPDVFRRMLPWLRSATFLSVMIIIGFSLAYGQFEWSDPWARIISHTLVGVIFASVIIAIISARRDAFVTRFFENKGLRRLGAYSYTMYLVHFGIGYVLFRYVHIWTDIPTIAGSSLPGLFAFIIAASIPTYAVGWLSWNFFESPILKLKRFFAYETKPEQRSEHESTGATLAAQPAVDSG